MKIIFRRVIFCGTIIRKRRRALGLSQRELANMCGTKQSNICRWENSMNVPNATQLALLSEILDFNISQVFIFKK